jgi:hypothetical protein
MHSVITSIVTGGRGGDYREEFEENIIREKCRLCRMLPKALHPGRIDQVARDMEVNKH